MIDFLTKEEDAGDDTVKDDLPDEENGNTFYDEDDGEEENVTRTELTLPTPIVRNPLPQALSPSPPSIPIRPTLPPPPSIPIRSHRIDSLKVSELKLELKTHGLKIAGNKSVLRARLIDFLTKEGSAVEVDKNLHLPIEAAPPPIDQNPLRPPPPCIPIRPPLTTCPQLTQEAEEIRKRRARLFALGLPPPT